MDTNIGKSESKQATQTSSNGSKTTYQTHTSKKPKKEWMSADTKPRKDNTSRVQTVLKI